MEYFENLMMPRKAEGPPGMVSAKDKKQLSKDNNRYSMSNADISGSEAVARGNTLTSN